MIRNDQIHLYRPIYERKVKYLQMVVVLAKRLQRTIRYLCRPNIWINNRRSYCNYFSWCRWLGLGPVNEKFLSSTSSVFINGGRRAAFRHKQIAKLHTKKKPLAVCWFISFRLAARETDCRFKRLSFTFVIRKNGFGINGNSSSVYKTTLHISLTTCMLGLICSIPWLNRSTSLFSNLIMQAILMNQKPAFDVWTTWLT